MAAFDEEKPPVEIPPEVVDDVDNDIRLSEEELVLPDDE